MPSYWSVMPASAGKAKAGMKTVQFFAPQCVTHAIPERLRGVFTPRCYTNPRLLLPLLFMFRAVHSTLGILTR